MNFLLKAVMAVSEGETYAASASTLDVEVAGAAEAAEVALEKKPARRRPKQAAQKRKQKDVDEEELQQQQQMEGSSAASSSPASLALSSASPKGSHYEDDVDTHAHAILMLRGVSSVSHEGSEMNSPGDSDTSSTSSGSKGAGKSKKSKLDQDPSRNTVDMARMREVNRQAAKRHRQMAKARRMEIAEKVGLLTKRNEMLRSECGSLQGEINLLRSSIWQAFAAQGKHPLEVIRSAAALTQA